MKATTRNTSKISTRMNIQYDQEKDIFVIQMGNISDVISGNFLFDISSEFRLRKKMEHESPKRISCNLEKPRDAHVKALNSRPLQSRK